MQYAMQVQKISVSKCMHKLSDGASTATKMHNAPFIFAWKQRLGLRFVDDEFLPRPAVVLCGVDIVNNGQHNAAKSIICSGPSSKRRPVVGPYADPRYQDPSPDTWSTSWYSPWYQPGQLPAQQSALRYILVFSLVMPWPRDHATLRCQMAVPRVDCR